MEHKTLNYIGSILLGVLLTVNLFAIIFLTEEVIDMNEKLNNQEVSKSEIVNIYITEQPVKEQPTRGEGREFIITAYDNSIESQGKWVDQTATGFNLKGQTLTSAKCIAVDPKVIPLSSKVELYLTMNTPI